MVTPFITSTTRYRAVRKKERGISQFKMKLLMTVIGVYLNHVFNVALVQKYTSFPPRMFLA